MIDRWIRRLAGVTIATVLTVAPVTASAHDIYALTVEQLREGMMKAASPAEKGFVLVDVRSPTEHAEGFIPGTDMNIDYREIKDRHRELGIKPEGHVVLYCQSGHRAGIAAKMLSELGYRHVYSVVGSMNAWKEAGYPVERGQ
ncbi:MAG: rhodanese-like domain-containing protein [Nitrospiraceae bacterium]